MPWLAAIRRCRCRPLGLIQSPFQLLTTLYPCSFPAHLGTSNHTLVLNMVKVMDQIALKGDWTEEDSTFYDSTGNYDASDGAPRPCAVAHCGKWRNRRPDKIKGRLRYLLQDYPYPSNPGSNNRIHQVHIGRTAAQLANRLVHTEGRVWFHYRVSHPTAGSYNSTEVMPSRSVIPP